MLPRAHRDRLVNRIESHVLLRELADHRELLVDRRGAEVTQVQAEVLPVRTVERAARLHLLDILDRLRALLRISDGRGCTLLSRRGSGDSYRSHRERDRRSGS